MTTDNTIKIINNVLGESVTQVIQEDYWEEIVPLTDFDAPNILTSLLPEPFASFAQALANQVEVDESVIVMAVLSIISVTTAKQFFVQVDWSESINTYTLISLPPANNKSSILRAVAEPLEIWETQQEELLGAIIKQKNSQRKTEERIIEAKRKEVTRQNISMAKKKELTNEIEELEANLTDPQHLPRLYATDITPEALAIALHEQSERFAIITDEGGIIETISGLYSSGGRANIDILLKGIDGGSTRIKRSSKEYKLKPYLTMLLMAQPQTLRNMSVRKSLEGNGFLERFLYLIPRSHLGSRKLNTAPVSKEIKEGYHKAILDILNLPKVEQPHKLALSFSAQQEFLTFRHTIEKQLAGGGILAECAGWGGKICGYTLRIAGQLHIAKYLERAIWLEIEYSTLINAIEIANKLILHARAAFHWMGATPTIRNAEKIVKWIKDTNISKFTKTELLKKFKNDRLGKAETLNQCLDQLISYNYLQLSKSGMHNKPITTYLVNPKFRDSQRDKVYDLINDTEISKAQVPEFQEFQEFVKEDLKEIPEIPEILAPTESTILQEPNSNKEEIFEEIV